MCVHLDLHLLIKWSAVRKRDHRAWGIRRCVWRILSWTPLMDAALRIREISNANKISGETLYAHKSRSTSIVITVERMRVTCLLFIFGLRGEPFFSVLLTNENENRFLIGQKKVAVCLKCFVITVRTSTVVSELIRNNTGQSTLKVGTFFFFLYRF